MITTEILSNQNDFDFFRKRCNELVHVDFPQSYLEQGFVRIFRKYGKIVGGYAVINDGPLRTVESLPCESFLKKEKNKLFEITALWMCPKEKNGLLSAFLWFNFSRDIANQKSKTHLIYAYDLDNKRLGKLYAMGKPEVVYRGKVKQLEGNTCENIESVEIACRKRISKIPIYNLHNFFTKIIFNKACLKDISLVKKVKVKYNLIRA